MRATRNVESGSRGKLPSRRVQLLWCAVLSLACARTDAPGSDRVSAQERDARAAPTQPASPPGDAAAGAAPVRAQLPDRCPPEMVHVPPGKFMMGEKKGDLAAPLHKVTLTKPYCIDRLEVTLGDYRKCEQAGVCTKTPARPGGGPACNEKREGRDKHPINCVTWQQASAYCQWAGKRLPSEAEWEFAARGPKSFKFPWGNRPPTEELAWNSMYTAVNRDYAKCADMGPKICPKRYEHWVLGTTEVGTHPQGASPFGVLDMGGNVGEWVQDWRVLWPKQNKDDAVDPTGPAEGTKKVIKDISWDGVDRSETVGRRSGGWHDQTLHNTVGMRCALSLAPPAP